MRPLAFVENDSHTKGGRGFLLEDPDTQLSVLLTVWTDSDGDHLWCVESLYPRRELRLNGQRTSEEDCIRHGKRQAISVLSDLLADHGRKGPRSSEWDRTWPAPGKDPKTKRRSLRGKDGG